MPGTEDQQPTADELESIRDGVRRHCDENGDAAFDAEDLCRLMREDGYPSRFFAHCHDQSGDQVENAVGMVVRSFRWRKETGVRSIASGSLGDAMKEKGALYSRNRDRDGKPLLVFEVRSHRRGEFAVEDMKRFFLYFLERLDRETDGDKLTLVFDCAGCGLKNMDMDFIQYMIGVFKDHYPNNLNYILVLEMPWVLSAAWKIIKSWLPAAAVKKIKFLNKSNLGEFVDPDQQRAAWGGTDDWQYEFVEEKLLASSNNNNDFPSTGDAADVPIENGEDSGDEGRNSAKKNVTFSTPRREQEIANGTPNASPGSAAPAPPPSFSDAHPSSGRGSSTSSLLEITPSDELVFEANAATNSIVAKVQIRNPSSASNSTVVFKIKTTSPDKYRVRPSTAAVKAGESCGVEIHVHPSHLSGVVVVVEDSSAADLKSLLTADGTASLLKDKFLVTAITVEDEDADNLSFSKLSELIKTGRPEAQYRLRCGIPGVTRSAAQPLRTGGSAAAASGSEKMPSSSTWANANKQLETLAKQVNKSNQSVTDLQEVVWGLKKLLMVLLLLVAVSNAVLIYKAFAEYPPPTCSSNERAVPEAWRQKTDL